MTSKRRAKVSLCRIVRKYGQAFLTYGTTCSGKGEYINPTYSDAEYILTTFCNVHRIRGIDVVETSANGRYLKTVCLAEYPAKQYVPNKGEYK